MNKPYIKEIVVVEGKTDSDKLKSIFNVSTIETNGFNLTKNKINQIISANNKFGVILFLDPDYVGNQIRNKILSYLPNAKQCFISKNDCLSSKKIGVANANIESIKNAFKNIKTYSKLNHSINWNQYLELNLNSKAKRILLCEKLKIAYCNHKQLFKYLNMLNLTDNEIKTILSNN